MPRTGAFAVPLPCGVLSGPMASAASADRDEPAPPEWDGCYDASMPELPEVQTVAAHLDSRLRGAVVEAVRLFRRDIVKGSPRSLQRSLPSKTLRRVRRHGKRIIFELSPNTELNFHLGMTGNLLVVRRDAPLLDHTHLRVRFAGAAQGEGALVNLRAR